MNAPLPSEAQIAVSTETQASESSYPSGMVVSFTQGHAGMTARLGGKGAHLAEMTRLGIPVPPGFTITTEACRHFHKANKRFPTGLTAEVEDHVKVLEETLNRTLGAAEAPLLVSVRSGAPVSMPGMMDTVLNLGLNDQAVVGLARASGDARFAWDSYRRFIQMFGSVVLEIPHQDFEAALDALKTARGTARDTDLSAGDLAELVDQYKAIVRAATGAEFPQEPRTQLHRAIRAVFESWHNPRASLYRELNGLDDASGTAVNVQAMVFGNRGETSGTGVVFTRDPSTGAPGLFGEFLPHAQGEDVVAGIRTPRPIAEMAAWNAEAYAKLTRTAEALEAHYKDMQDIEFTVEDGELFLLQTRAGKRSAAAAARIAVDLEAEGKISRDIAVSRVPATAVEQLLHPAIAAGTDKAVIATGLPASPGAAAGTLVFSAAEAERRAAAGKDVILARRETSPEDLHGMHAARGFITALGGMTSHAAVVARGMGRPCVCGISSITIDEAAGQLTLADGRTLTTGDAITIDGAAGEVHAGVLPMAPPQLDGPIATVLAWADAIRDMDVRANADTKVDAARARDFGAAGIGLTRTEHMFFAPDRISAMREMILADTQAARDTALARLLPFQRDDFHAILDTMDGLPVTIRLLDPPLHEFLPRDEGAIAALAAELKMPVAQLTARIEALSEANPMMGHRGCRLLVSHPEIAAMQARAVYEAAAALTREGKNPLPEIMIPLVGLADELQRLRAVVEKTAAVVAAEQGITVPVSVGTMIELPRACLVADRIAENADFFSFGTNDLTQFTFGFSRDDTGRFLGQYKDGGVLKDDPFATIDQDGVGGLMRTAIDRSGTTRPTLKRGVCGEHGGDPASIHFCHQLGLDYVSCSPFRVPVARLAAAHAALAQPRAEAASVADAALAMAAE